MGKAVFLLHGFLSDIHDFDPLMDFLTDHYDHVEKVTYPGHKEGENYWDFECDQTFKLVNETFENLQKKYDIIDVIGFSMGGALGVYLSHKYQFNKLVLLAPANKYFNFYLPYSMIRYFFFNLISLEKAVIQKNQEDKEKFREKITMALDDDKYGIKFIQDKYLKPYFFKAYSNFRNLIKKANEDIKEIKNPCFIAWGELDQLVPKKSASYIFELCTNDIKHVKIYNDISHLMLRSSFNKQLIEDIIEFLGENKVYNE